MNVKMLGSSDDGGRIIGNIDRPTVEMMPRIEMPPASTGKTSRLPLQARLASAPTKPALAR